MSWQVFSKSVDLGDGNVITIETGKLARQADGAVLVKMGKTALLATAVSAKEAKEGQSFFPLSVDYQEKFASTGRIPGSFHRREGRLSAYEILISRLVDRALRPLFPDNYLNETQIIISLLSYDTEMLPDALVGLAASAALTVSDIPFSGPISEVRVARIEGKFVINPSASQLALADMDILLGATMTDVMMVEGEMQEVSEEDLVEAIKLGHAAIKVQCQAQLELREMCGKEKRTVEAPEENEEIRAKVAEFVVDKINEVIHNPTEKHERKEKLSAIKDALIESYGEEVEEETLAFVKKYYYEIEKKTIRAMILNEQVRLDGRQLHEVRPLNIEVDFLDLPHGSSLFCRGETQSLTTVTLGSKLDEQLIDKAAGLEHERFLLHYNFPPFSTGETKFLRGPSRREIGHGNLAMRSLKPVLPPDEDNPYTIRIVSDILESNGSSSMATVCAGSLALMDAGIPIKSGVSGIAMGLISDGEKVAVLTDILGDEDHLGDMDFKVTGTVNGICAVQMDIKIDGLPYEVLTQALRQANEGRLHILGEMNKVIEVPRAEPKPHAPRIDRFKVAREYMGAIIGSGGKVIQEIQRETNTTVNIEEIKGTEEARVSIFATNKADIEKAKKWVIGIVTEPEEGEIYEAEVKSIMPYGAFVEFLPGKEGLLHISEISWKRLESMDDVFKEGDIVKVQLIGIDRRSGKFKLSRKVLVEKPIGYVEPSRNDYRSDRGGGDRGGYRGGGGRDRDRGGYRDRGGRDRDRGGYRDRRDRR